MPLCSFALCTMHAPALAAEVAVVKCFTVPVAADIALEMVAVGIAVRVWVVVNYDCYRFNYSFIFSHCSEFKKGRKLLGWNPQHLKCIH